MDHNRISGKAPKMSSTQAQNVPATAGETARPTVTASLAEPTGSTTTMGGKAGMSARERARLRILERNKAKAEAQMAEGGDENQENEAQDTPGATKEEEAELSEGEEALKEAMEMMKKQQQQAKEQGTTAARKTWWRRGRPNNQANQPSQPVSATPPTADSSQPAAGTTTATTDGM